MNCSNRWRVVRPLAGICLILFLAVRPISSQQAQISLKAQATQWLMDDAPPNPPLRGWLDGLSMLIKQEKNVDAPVQVTSSVLPSGLVQVQAKVGPNVFLWQVDYQKRKYYSMNKFTSDFMGLVAKGGAIR